MLAKPKFTNKPSDGASYKERAYDKKIPKHKPNYKCGFCGIKGHKESKCFKKKNQNKQTTSNEQSGLCFFTKVENKRLDNKWCLDSGCTSHLCSDQNAFVNMTSTNSNLQLASNATTSVQAKGDVQIALSDAKHSTITLKDTLYVPDLRTNLISIAKIVDNDYDVTFKRHGAIITDLQGEIQASAVRAGDLFYLNDNEKSCQSMAATNKNKVDMIEWHARLGHLNAKDLTTMMKSNCVVGLEYKKFIDLSKCTTCLAAKITSTPFQHRESVSKEPLEIVHTDICGLMRTESVGRSQYFINFIDDHTRWCQVYFIRNKEEAVHKFIEYKNMVETQTGRKVKAIQSDGGREYCNQ